MKRRNEKLAFVFCLIVCACIDHRVEFIAATKTDINRIRVNNITYIRTYALWYNVYWLWRAKTKNIYINGRIYVCTEHTTHCTVPTYRMHVPVVRRMSSHGTYIFYVWSHWRCVYCCLYALAEL